MKDVAFICYSHSEYSDVWDLFFGQLNKYFPNVKKYLFTDKVNREILSDINVVTYDNNLAYSKRVSHCLDFVKEDLCIFHHEDMVLLNHPQEDKLKEICNFLRKYKIDFVKLLKGGHLIDIKLDDMPLDNLYWIPHNSNGISVSFAIQPTIWKVKTLKDIYTNSGTSDVKGNIAAGQFELFASEYVNKNKIMGLYWFSDEKKRGLYHWDSSLYPHGNLISKGKWAAEYKEEFKELHQTYNIDINLRGTT